MSKARLVITAIETEGITQAEAAHRYGLSEGWVSKLMARRRAEGDAAYEPSNYRPCSRSSPPRTTGTARTGPRPEPTSVGSGLADVLRHHIGRADRI